jgi:hypothetical protein
MLCVTRVISQKKNDCDCRNGKLKKIEKEKKNY